MNATFGHKAYLILVISILAVACSPVSRRALTKKFVSLEDKLQDHTGFMLYDIEQKKEVHAFQANRYFTPASNTKIFTFYASLLILRDSIPALRYVQNGDSLIFAGTGDPSFLYENVNSSGKVFSFLLNTDKKLYLADGNFHTSAIGRGWAADDLPYVFSSERSAFPIYGNYFTLYHFGKTFKTMPGFFSYNITVKDSVDKARIERDLSSNKINFYPAYQSTVQTRWETPFKTNAELSAKLLADTLEKEVVVIKRRLSHSATVVYNTPVDSVYKIMMQESDNFIAEQLLLTCAGVLSDSLKPEIAINYMKKNHLTDLPDEPIWVDGSGLSRYNLFTPRSLVKLWEKIYALVPRERLFPLLAIGGKTGTVKNWYKNEPPYLYGKTGTLSNNHSLSGYLITKSGRSLIFSFMSNNHPGPSATVRKEMEMILKELYLHY